MSREKKQLKLETAKLQAWCDLPPEIRAELEGSALFTPQRGKWELEYVQHLTPNLDELEEEEDCFRSIIDQARALGITVHQFVNLQTIYLEQLNLQDKTNKKGLFLEEKSCKESKEDKKCSAQAKGERRPKGIAKSPLKREALLWQQENWGLLSKAKYNYLLKLMVMVSWWFPSTHHVRVMAL